MNYRPIVFAAALACGAVTPAMAGGTRAVIELFTSQGCSSCPPADRLLGELARDPTLVTMSLPVDYWDYLGWKDTLALHGHSCASSAYSPSRAATARCYTPQAVINGVVAVARQRPGRRSSGRSRKPTAPMRPLTLPVNLTVADGTVTVHVPAADRRGQKRRGLAVPGHRQGAGQDRPRREPRPHHHLHQRRAPLGEARRRGTARRRTFSYKLADLPDKRFTLAEVDRLAVLVQSGTRAQARPDAGRRDRAMPRGALILLWSFRGAREAREPGIQSARGDAGSGFGVRARALRSAPRNDGGSKKIGPAVGRPEGHWGLNRTRNSNGPAGRAPGGWGAEESGVLHRTGP